MNGSIMARLRGETRELHTYAETRPLQKALVKGTLPREGYAAYLGQMLLVHAALEAQLRARSEAHAAFGRVFKPHQQREGNLRSDLAFYGVDSETIEPVDATRAAVAEIERLGAQRPVSLLGMLYVLEGSMNGAKFIARAIAKAYGLEAGPGLSYLDPYGERQQEMWQAFKADMDAAGFTDEEKDELVEAARKMFRMVADISDESFAPVAA